VCSFMDVCRRYDLALEAAEQKINSTHTPFEAKSEKNASGNNESYTVTPHPHPSSNTNMDIGTTTTHLSYITDLIQEIENKVQLFVMLVSCVLCICALFDLHTVMGRNDASQFYLS